MEFFLGRFKNLIILMVVLFLQVLGLAVQVKRANDPQSTRLIRVWVVGAITPLERGLVWIQNGTATSGTTIFICAACAPKTATSRNKSSRCASSKSASARTRPRPAASGPALVQRTFVSRTVAAQVIGTSGSDLSRSIYIDKGSEDGIKPDMAVITSDGIVGKVLRVFSSTSLILLINDQSSGVGAIVEKSRLQGVIRGTPNGEVTLERVMTDEQVMAGDVVLSSGGDQIFPKGMPIGTVTKVGAGKELFLNVKIRPAANLSKLEKFWSWCRSKSAKQ